MLFVVLEVVSLSLLFNSYSYHRSLKFSTVSDFSGSVFSTYNSITDYFSLRSENVVLAEENAALQNQLKSSFYLNDSTNDFSDTLYQYIAAKIISNSITKPNNYLLIDKGEKHGIDKEMGVVSPFGVTGIVVGSSDNYSIVMSMLHQNTRISGRAKKGGQLVNLVWPGFDFRACKVIDIPSHVVLREGDSIVTSGNSLIFPEGILIGTIIKQEINANEELSEATLMFSTDFSALKHVYVIKNKKREEQIMLLEEFDDD